MSPKKLATLGLFTTMSLIIYGVECAIPPLVPIPGIKLGLANIVTLVLLRDFSLRDAILVLLARILLSALLFGQALSLLYSLTGGIVSLFLMALFHHFLRKKEIVITSILGGIGHNLGQIAVALFLTKTIGILAYLPFLLLSGILTGCFTGFCAHFLQGRIPRDR